MQQLETGVMILAAAANLHDSPQIRYAAGMVLYQQYNIWPRPQLYQWENSMDKNTDICDKCYFLCMTLELVLYLIWYLSFHLLTKKWIG